MTRTNSKSRSSAGAGAGAGQAGYYPYFTLLLLNSINGNSTKKNRLSLTLRKLSAFECGIEPLGDSRMKFEILYYLIGLLYLLLDLEIVLLFPLVVRLFTLPPLAFLIVLAFMILLTLGFLYEWLRGALEIIMIYATFIRPLFDTGLLGCLVIIYTEFSVEPFVDGGFNFTHFE